MDPFPIGKLLSPWEFRGDRRQDLGDPRVVRVLLDQSAEQSTRIDLASLGTLLRRRDGRGPGEGLLQVVVGYGPEAVGSSRLVPVELLSIGQVLSRLVLVDDGIAGRQRCMTLRRRLRKRLLQYLVLQFLQRDGHDARAFQDLALRVFLNLVQIELTVAPL